MSDEHMHFEWRTDAPQRRITWAVQRLILLHVVAYAAQLVAHIPFGVGGTGVAGGLPPGGAMIGWLAFRPEDFFGGAVWKPVTYMLLHANLHHLCMNMLWLYFFGPEVERVLSTRQFFRFYVICGAVAVLGTIAPYVVGWGNAPVIGASGAVMAVLVAFAVANPDKPIHLFPFPKPISARGLVYIAIGFNLVSALLGTNVSVATHFGGMAAGYVYMKLVPRVLRWTARRQAPKKTAKEPGDSVGDAVDNIFKFEQEKWKRKH